QRGEFLPFLKGGQEGFNLQCLYNYGLTNKSIKANPSPHEYEVGFLFCAIQKKPFEKGNVVCCKCKKELVVVSRNGEEGNHSVRSW
ncbi:MAG: hypothetical protein QME78_16985, partial [Thermodesulfobacteriota bacterium]|nr:hypothetical protein [Thermodesulfobacteriota bacterium]